MMQVRPDLALIRQQAEDLKRTVEQQFPSLEVEYADWLELLERVRQGEVPDVIELDFGADVYLWIRGDRKLAEQAVTLAYDRESELWGESGVITHIRAKDTIWCRKTGPYDVRTLPEDIPLYRRKDKRGVCFLCVVTAEHEHDWGKVQPEE